MTSPNLSKLLQAIGCLDDLSEALKKGNCVNMKTLHEKIGECSVLAQSAISDEIDFIKMNYERQLTHPTVDI